MEPEESKDNADDFGKVVDALHNREKLAALRTYQGDMAEFIKEKNESVISIAVKEKERKEEREEKKIKIGEVKLAPKPKSGRFKANATMVLISLLLLAGGLVGYMFVFQVLKKEPVPEVVLEKTIIPYNDFITLANVTKENFGSELWKAAPGNGISLLKISGSDGVSIEKSKDFFSFLKVGVPFTLARNLKDDYTVGILSQNNQTSPFIIVAVNDFGGAFAGMLDWEEKIQSDLSFLNPAAQTAVAPASSLKQETFVWKDVIVKNKDTRALVSERGNSKIAYTFLDKNTLLIVGNISAIGEISSIYASRAVAR